MKLRIKKKLKSRFLAHFFNTVIKQYSNVNHQTTLHIFVPMCVWNTVLCNKNVDSEHSVISDFENDATVIVGDISFSTSSSINIYKDYICDRKCNLIQKFYYYILHYKMETILHESPIIFTFL